MPTAPTVARGIITTQTEQTNIKKDISEVIDFLSPFDVPFLDLVGRDSLRTPCTQIKHEWLTDQLEPRAGTLAVAHVANDGQLTLTSPQGKYVVPGDMILLEASNVVYRITGGVPDTNVATVDVVRGGAGAVDAASAVSAAWRKVAHAAQEAGSARNDGPKTSIDNPYNYTQIIKDWIIVSGSMEVIARYGYANERAYQEEKVLKRLAIDLEHALIYGARSFNAGPPRVSTMGGLFEFVLLPGIANSWPTVYNAGGLDFTETLLNNLMQKIFENGGEVDFVALNGTNKRRVTSWATPRIRTTQGERKAGASIGTYESDFGTLDFILDRWLRPNDIIIGSRGAMGIGPLIGRAFSSRQLPSTIDGTWFELLGEYTEEVRRPDQSWAWIYNTSTTY